MSKTLDSKRRTIQMTNLTYILKKGKAQPAYQYALESPFIDDRASSKFQRSHSRSGSAKKTHKEKISKLLSIGKTNVSAKIETPSLKSIQITDIDENLPLPALAAENQKLKQELESQIAIFEQYIKVAQL